MLHFVILTKRGYSDKKTEWRIPIAVGCAVLSAFGAFCTAVSSAEGGGRYSNARIITRSGGHMLRVANARGIGYDRSMVRHRIRLAKPGDLNALAEMRYRFRAELRSPAEPKSRFVRRCRSWIRARFWSGSSSWRCWVVDDGRQLLGHVCVQLFEKMPNPVNEAEVHAY
jgi:hypothetical protein